jgi:addiction module HigA family antidote
MRKMIEKRLAPVHPGDLLREILDELDISAYALAKSIGKAPIQVSRILAGNASVTANMARRIGGALGTSAEMWMNLQSQYDLERSKRENPDIQVVQIVSHGALVSVD